MEVDLTAVLFEGVATSVLEDEPAVEMAEPRGSFP